MNPNQLFGWFVTTMIISGIFDELDMSGMHRTFLTISVVCLVFSAAKHLMKHLDGE